VGLNIFPIDYEENERFAWTMKGNYHTTQMIKNPLSNASINCNDKFTTVYKNSVTWITKINSKHNHQKGRITIKQLNKRNYIL
jgi:hypothetical protein